MALVAFLALSLVTGMTTAHERYTPDSARSTPFDHDETPTNNSSISIQHSGNSVILDAADNQTIRGETTLDPGTKLEVQVHATKRFFMSNSVSVQSDGTFNATFNFSEYDPGTKFAVDVGLPRNNSTETDTLATIDGVLQNRSMKSGANSTTTTTAAATRTSETMASTASTATVTDRAMANGTDSTTETGTVNQSKTASDGQPGFGLFVALLAFVGIGLLRRND